MAGRTKFEKSLNLPSVEDINKALEILHQNDLQEMVEDAIVKPETDEEVEEMDEAASKNLNEEIANFERNNTDIDTTDVPKVPMILDDNEEFEKDMDEIAEQANRGYESLMDLSLEVETKSTADIASAAKEFLATKLNAKMAKYQRKLDMINLTLQDRRVSVSEKKMQAAGAQPAEVIEDDGESFTLTTTTRNKLTDR